MTTKNKAPARYFSLNEFADLAHEAGVVHVGQPERLYETFRMRKTRNYLPTPDCTIGDGADSKDGWTLGTISKWIESKGGDMPTTPEEADAASVPVIPA